MELLTPKDTMKIFKCSLAKVYKMADSGELPCVRIPCLGKGKRKKRDMVRFKREDIFRFIENHYHPTNY